MIDIKSSDYVTSAEGVEVTYAEWVGGILCASYDNNSSEALDHLGPFTEYGDEVDSTLSLATKTLMIYNSIDRDKMARTASTLFVEESAKIMKQWEDDGIRSHSERVEELYEQLIDLIRDYLYFPC